MNKLNKARTHINEAIQAIQKELLVAENGQSVVSVVILQDFLAALKTLRELIETGGVPPKSQRSVYMGRIITDSWPFDYYLSEVVVRAENSYLNI
jgi:hypothetical protein